MVNQTLVTDQLFLDTFIITSSGQKYLHSAKGKLKYKELVFLLCVDYPIRDAYTVSDVVLFDCLGSTNYVLNLFWGIVLN